MQGVERESKIFRSFLLKIGMEKTIAESQGIQYTKAYDFKYL